MLANSNLIQLIKKIAMDAVTASKPCDVLIGKVKSVSPLTVAVSQKLILDEDFLTVSDNARIRIRKNSSVIMVRRSGGQQFFVIDTIGETEVIL